MNWNFYAIVCTIIVLHYSVMQGNAASNDYSIIPVEDPDEDGKVETNGDQEVFITNSEKFEPTPDWKKIKPGQAIPTGLHVRMDMQTGEKEAKLMENSIGDEKRTMSRQELKDALKEFKTDSFDVEDKEREKEVLANFKDYKSLKEDFEKIRMSVKTEAEIVTDLVEKIAKNATKMEEAKRLSVLEDLEYYLHQFDNAVVFCDLNGMNLMLKELNHSNPSLVRLASSIIGVAVQSNPKAKINALENGVLQVLLSKLKTSSDLKLVNKFLFALSSLIRDFPYAQQRFIDLDGLAILRSAFTKEEKGHKIKLKIITLLSDLVSEQTNSLKNDDITSEKFQQYNRISIKAGIVENHFCEAVPTLLYSDSNHDCVEKTLSAMIKFSEMCKNHYTFIRDKLDNMYQPYEVLASGEMKEKNEDKYFSKIRDNILHLLQIIPWTHSPHDDL